jgi:hypothetical protein
LHAAPAAFEQLAVEKSVTRLPFTSDAPPRIVTPWAALFLVTATWRDRERARASE